MPIDLMRETVSVYLERCISSLCNLSSFIGTNHQETMNKLQSMIGKWLVIVAEKEEEISKQKDLLQKSVDAKLTELKPAISYNGDNIRVSNVQDMLQREREELQRQREELETERKGFTEAAIKLGLEKAAIQREKALLAARNDVEVSETLTSKLPVTPAWLKAKPTNVTPPQKPIDLPTRRCVIVYAGNPLLKSLTMAQVCQNTMQVKRRISLIG
jgi:hypothetical protein